MLSIRDWHRILRDPNNQDPTGGEPVGEPLPDGTPPSGEEPMENVQDARAELLEMDGRDPEPVQDPEPTPPAPEPVAAPTPEPAPPPEPAEPAEPTPEPQPAAADPTPPPKAEGQEPQLTPEEQMRNEVARLYGLLGRHGIPVTEQPAQAPAPAAEPQQPQWYGQPPAQPVQPQAQPAQPAQPVQPVSTVAPTAVQPQQYVQQVPAAGPQQNLQFVDDELHTQIIQSPEAFNQVLTTLSAYVLENIMGRVPNLVENRVSTKMDQVIRVTDFYRANPDLVDFKEAVKGIAIDMANANPNMTLEQLYSDLGGESRRRLNLQARMGQPAVSPPSATSAAPAAPTFAPSAPAARPAGQLGSVEQTVRDQIEELLAL